MGSVPRLVFPSRFIFFEDSHGDCVVAGSRICPAAAIRRICSRRSTKAVPVGLMYAGLALWSTWPLLRNPATTLPLGPSQVATVPLFNLWTIWWNADRLRHGLKEYWEAPIFYPERDTFAF